MLAMPGPLPCAVAAALAIAVLGVGRPDSGITASVPTGLVDVVGTVGGPVVATLRGRGAPLYTHTHAETVWLWTEAAIEPGQEIRVHGRLRAPRGFLAPGSPDRAIAIASRGASLELDARSVVIIRDDPGITARIWRAAGSLQRTLAANLPADDPAGAALRGIVTGDRSRIPRDLDDRWRIAGIYHVLSVSGLHLAVIAGLAFALLRRLVAASPLGGRSRPARWAAPLALTFAVAYTLVTGAQIATLRALLVVAIVLVAQMVDRPVRLVDALGVAALAILAWRPQDLYDASFQLSFVAALTLALRPPRDVPTGWPARVKRAVLRGLATSAWVTIATAPLTAFHFQQVTLGGIVGNLVLTPFVELIALPLGLAGALIGDPGTLLVVLATTTVAAVDHVAGLLAPHVPIASIAIESPVVMAMLVALGLWLAARRQHARIELAAWAALCIIWTLARSALPDGALRITFLDVGQGDAAIVELPDGDVWLVDAGGLASARDARAATSPGLVIERSLRVYGKSAIDLAVISHPHPDHYLGLAALGVPVHELWSVPPDEPDDPDEAPRRSDASRSFTSIRQALADRGTSLAEPQLGALRTRDGVELAVWAPQYAPSADARPRLAADPVRSVNDNSLVISIRYAGRTILFTGDLEDEGEAALVAAGLPRVDVVKVAHHGSRTSSSRGFVAATRPELAVISCGVGNAFGFPADEVLERWRAVGADVARTDRDGTVTVTINAAGDLVVERSVGREATRYPGAGK